MNILHGGVGLTIATATQAAADHSTRAAVIVAVGGVLGALGIPFVNDRLKRRHTRSDNAEMALSDKVSALLTERYDHDMRRKDEELAYKDDALRKADERYAALQAENDRLRRRR